MKVIKPSFELLGNINPYELIKHLEYCARTCYKSEGLITDSSAEPLLRRIIKSGHESVIEHDTVTVRIICDRGVSHEIVRHRIASYSQESTRYCNYSKDKYGKELTFIKPLFWKEDSSEYKIWEAQMQSIEDSYLNLIQLGATPDQARSILPNSLKTEIVVTMNFREWRHFFKLRTSKRAHPQMREITIPLFNRFCELFPALFDDIQIDE